MAAALKVSMLGERRRRAGETPAAAPTSHRSTHQDASDDCVHIFEPGLIDHTTGFAL
ncbi:hypothetical protein [Microbispora sp. CA-102843]|uniref:hypothetical protein n=1 Tax=Microbispora sp. CA-102843 TaxID=3239952 RepID=UPI003D89B3FD